MQRGTSTEILIGGRNPTSIVLWSPNCHSQTAAAICSRAPAARWTSRTSTCLLPFSSMLSTRVTGTSSGMQFQEHYCAALLPVAASTRIAPVMCGCKEQKYSYVPGVVNANENLSFVSSAFDLKSLLLEAIVCGTSSSLVQVTVVPAFTVMRCGRKANWSMSTSVSAASAGL